MSNLENKTMKEYAKETGQTYIEVTKDIIHNDLDQVRTNIKYEVEELLIDHLDMENTEDEDKFDMRDRGNDLIVKTKDLKESEIADIVYKNITRLISSEVNMILKIDEINDYIVKLEESKLPKTLAKEMINEIIETGIEIELIAE